MKISIVRTLSAASVLIMALLCTVTAASGAEEDTLREQITQSVPAQTKIHIVYGIALTVGLSCLSAGYAVGKVGAAALGAASEKPELMGRAMIFVGLAEGIAIYGLIIGILLLGKL